MDVFIPEQTAPQHIQEALDALQAALIAPDLDILTMAVVSDALGRLTEQHPLYVPAEPETPLDVRTGVTRAVSALTAANRDQHSPWQIAQLALITRDLQSILRSAE